MVRAVATAPESRGDRKPVADIGFHGITSFIPALNGYRGVIIILVMLGHFSHNAIDLGLPIPGIRFGGFGWIGVDLFFVLSGFLITGILYDSKGTAKYFRNFYMKRSLRIFPLYFLALALVLLVTPLWPLKGLEWTSNPAFIAVYLTNFLVAAGGSAGILDHFWSLAVEEHFYLLWPMVVFLLPRRKILAVAIGMMIVAPLIRTYFAYNGFNEYTTYMLTPSRMDSLAVGAVAALLVRGEGSYSPRIRRIAWSAMLSAVVLMLAAMIVRDTFMYYDPVLAVVGHSLVGIAASGSLIVGITWRPLNWVLNWRVLHWLGKYSYGIYVWHPIVAVLIVYSGLRELVSEPSIPVNFAWWFLAIGLSLFAAWLSYNLFEEKFLKLKDRFQPKKQKAAPALPDLSEDDVEPAAPAPAARPKTA